MDATLLPTLALVLGCLILLYVRALSMVVAYVSLATKDQPKGRQQWSPCLGTSTNCPQCPQFRQMSKLTICSESSLFQPYYIGLLYVMVSLSSLI